MSNLPDDLDGPPRWAEVRFRPPPTKGLDRESHRFTLGVFIFIATALVYPWYSYWVNSTMVSRELKEVSAEFERQSQAAQKQFAADAQRAGEVAMRAQQESDEASRQRRLAAVSVAGVSAGGSMPTVLVSLGTSDIYEANATICRQAERWLKTNLSGKTLRVQSHRGNRPAVDVGQVACR